MGDRAPPIKFFSARLVTLTAAPTPAPLVPIVESVTPVVDARDAGDCASSLGRSVRSALLYIVTVNVLGMLAALCFLVNAIEENEDVVVVGGVFVC